MANRVSLFICDQCSQGFNCKSHMIWHINNIHGEQLTFVCDVCSKEFNRKRSLASHIEAQHQHGIHAVKCQLCLTDFGSKSGLRRHYTAMHEGSLTKKFECDTCGKAFRLKSILLAHIGSIHEQRRPVECVICGATLTHRWCLRTHKAALHDGIQFQCDHCDAGFGTKGALISHIRSVHLKLRPFACSQCGARFTKKCSLDHHVKSVHKKIMFTCDVCSKSITTKCELAKHCFCLHMKLRLFKCSVCGQVCGRAYNLRRHTRNIHG